MGDPDHAFTKNLIFNDKKFLEIAFIIGVAHGRGVLPKRLETRWMTFLLYYMPEIYNIDRFTRAQYQQVCDFMKDIVKYAKSYKKASPEHITEAEKAAPKETWTPPKSLDEWIEETWDFVVKW